MRGLAGDTRVALWTLITGYVPTAFGDHSDEAVEGLGLLGQLREIRGLHFEQVPAPSKRKVPDSHRV